MARLRGKSGLFDRGIYASTSAPGGTGFIGQLWYNSATGVTYQYTNDGASSFWLDVSSAGIGTSASRGVDFAGTTDPKLTTNGTGLAVGSIYYNITTNKHFVCTDATTNQNGWSGGFVGMGGNVIRDYTYNSISYRVHKFTSSGTFIMDAQTNVDILLVGGGGNSGGTNVNGSGGGGAGELFWTSISNLSIGAYPVVVGGGAPTSSNTSSNGYNSFFDRDRGNMVRVYGGGQGGNFAGNALSGGGGSGGGAGRDAGNTNAAAAAKLNSGGHANVGGYNNIGSYGAAAGGGGAGGAGRNIAAAGGTASPHFGDHNGYHASGGGGIGNSTFIGSSAAETTAFLLGALAGTDASNVATVVGSTGTLYIAAGGGGAVYKTNDTTTTRGLKTGAAGGGGRNHLGTGTAGEAGQANTGSGGGGGRHATHSAGGSGVCIIRYVIT